METKKKEESNHIPVVIGNYSPFRIVLRETDKWNPTLVEINNNSYDYVKLSRLSSFIDIGIAPFSLAISFDGSLVLPATPEFRIREKALDKFNETLGILLLGGIYSEAIQPTDVSFGTLFFDGYLKHLGGGTGYHASFHNAIKTRHAGILDVIKLLKPETINVIQITEAYKKGREYFKMIEMLSPSLLLNGTSNYVKHQWAESLIFLWTSIEQIITIIWTKEIITGSSKDGIIIGRSKFLSDFRTWTASTQIELLYQKGFLKIEDYKLLNSARKSRNNFIHNGVKLTEEIVGCALQGLFRLISLVITNYENASVLNNTLEMIFKHQRGDLFPKAKQPIEGVTHWLSIPPLPGDKNWGNKKYEIIDELVLKPIKV